MLTAYPMQRMTLPQNERLLQVIQSATRLWSVKHVDGLEVLVEYRCKGGSDVAICINRDGEIPWLVRLGT